MTAVLATAGTGAPASVPQPREAAAVQGLGDLPLTFVENRGQSDRRVRYEAQGSRYAFHFTPEAIALSFFEAAPSPERRSTEGIALALKFIGANRDVEVTAGERAEGTVNHLRGDDPKRWQTDLPTYGIVLYRELWPGIDMLVRGSDGELKYEFRVRRGADVSDIRLAYAGAEGLALDDDGGLALQTAMGTLHDSPPVSYQEIDGVRVPVESRYVAKDDGADPQYGFALGEHRADRELVIDPSVQYSTFLGGSSDEDGNDVAVDSAGNTYIVGTTQSSDLPTTTGAFDRSFAGGAVDVFVAKLNATGSGLVYATYLGGTPTPPLLRGAGDPFEFGRAIAVDGEGNAYVTGQTTSGDFPTTSGAFDPELAVADRNATDAFVTKLNPQGSGLVYSTFLGGTGVDDGRGIAVDAAGNAHVVGQTGSSDHPTTSGAFDTTAAGSNDTFVTKLNASGSGLVYSTYLGGAENELIQDVAIAPDGNAIVAGGTRSTEFPTTAGAFDTTHNGGAFDELFDAHVTKLNSTGTALVYSTFLGGSNTDDAGAVAVDGSGNAYVTGGTLSSEFPTTAGAFDRNAGPRSDGLAGTSDTFVTKLNATGSSLVYSTFLSQGGGGDIAVEPDDSAWIVGGVSAERAQNADNVHTTADGFQTQFGGGGSDAHVVHLNAAGSALEYGTYLGGTNSEGATGVALDSDGSVYVVGNTLSGDFPTTTGAFDTTFGGDPALFWGDAFVTKFTAAAGEPPPPAPAALSTLALDPTSVTGGDPSTGTVTLTATAPTGGASVALTSSNTSAATVPTSVTVPAGATSATFTVSTSAVSADTTSTITATYEGVVKTASLTVKAPVAAPRETTSFSGRLDRNQTVTHTVQVGASGPVDMVLDWNDTRANVSLRVRDSSGAVVFSDGSNAKPKRGAFTAGSAGAYRFDVINNSSRSPRYTLSVTHPVASAPEPAPAALSSLTLTPTSVTGGDPSTGTVTLSAAAPTGGASVALTSSNTSAATVPASVTVAAGATSATFTVSTSAVSSDTTSTITATYGGVSRTASLAVTAPVSEPAPAALSSLTLDPTTVTGGNASTGTVTLTSAAPVGGVSVALASSNTSAATVPAGVTVPAGATSATFTVSTNAVSSDTTATITATYQLATRTATLAVTAPATSTDTVTISRAEYETDKRQLRVEASSSATGATLRVYVTSTDELIGTLSGGRGEFSWLTNPQNVTVKSSLGGSASRAVTAK